ncbi:hypothetical protein PCE1_001786 [Barthelona sp. PCE]
MESITFVTGNKNKAAEVEKILEGMEVVALDVDLGPEVQEMSVEEVSIMKCRAAMAHPDVTGPIIVEDTGLCFHAIGNLPGPFIKFFLKKLHHEGLNNMLMAYEDKSAHAECVLCFNNGVDEEIYTFVGQCQGKIVPARGPHAFGWDPIFEPVQQEAEEAQTYAEMSAEYKNSISHRGQAVLKFADFLKEW